MGRELSDVFKAKTRVGQRKILDKFDISKEDKNKFLNDIEDTGSGGSGESSGDSSNIEYLDVSGLDKTDFSIKSMIKLSILVKVSTEYGNMIAPLAYTTMLKDLDMMIHNTSAICINNSLIVDDRMAAVTVGETVKLIYPNIDAIPRITKEQFYSLE